jgi:hypothetical protein
MSNLYYVQQVGPNLVMLAPVGGGHPDQGLPGGGPVDPGYGVGGGLHPSHGLPGMPPHVSNRPPGSWPGHPDQGLPSNPNFPDNSLPSTPPPVLLPGYTLVMVRGPAGKWEYAFIAPSDPPPKPMPKPPVGPDNTLPPGPANPIAPGGSPPVATQPPMPGQLPSGPPTAAPKPV